MKHILILPIILAVLFSITLRAQQYETMTYLNQYSVVNQPGATLAQVVDTLNAHANPTDTGEGGAMDQIKEFRLFWQGRVALNDSSGAL